MKVFLQRVEEGEEVIDLVPGSGHVGVEAEEGGYKISIGIEAVFIKESDMERARETGERIRLERYGD